jgi:ribosomal peptide maturation radical SAM protein 1
MKKTLLISMPFGALDRQGLGISLLKASLTKRHLPCAVRYFTFAFAEAVGYDDYQWLTTQLPYTAFAGDWLFTQSLYGLRTVADQEYIQQILRETWRLGESDIARVLRMRTIIPFFLDHCLTAIDWNEYAIVGFTSTFEQNIASLALAQMIKRRNPEICIVFGGANWESVMGQELHKQFPFIDYVCSGEADETFPQFVQYILAGKLVDDPAHPLPGLVLRRGGESVYTGPAAMIQQMDDLPVPDFSDYFAQLSQSMIAATVLPTLIMETSRGCWWGAKSHCTFCGLNGESMTYRSKSARRAFEELTYLVDHWNIDFVAIVDNS